MESERPSYLRGAPGNVEYEMTGSRSMSGGGLTTIQHGDPDGSAAVSSKS